MTQRKTCHFVSTPTLTPIKLHNAITWHSVPVISAIYFYVRMLQLCLVGRLDRIPCLLTPMLIYLQLRIHDGAGRWPGGHPTLRNPERILSSTVSLCLRLMSSPRRFSGKGLVVRPLLLSEAIVLVSLITEDSRCVTNKKSQALSYGMESTS